MCVCVNKYTCCLFKNKELLRWFEYVNVGPNRKKKVTNTKIPSVVEGGLYSVVANVQDCDIVVSKFDLQSRYYVPFRTNSFRNVWTPYSFQLWVK